MCQHVHRSSSTRSQCLFWKCRWQWQNYNRPPHGHRCCTSNCLDHSRLRHDFRKELYIDEGCNFHLKLKGSRQKKHGYFTVRLTVRVDPPPLTVSCFVIFSEGRIWLWFMIIHELKRILTKKSFLTLYLTLTKTLAEWRCAFQVVTTATMEPRMQWWEVH